METETQKLEASFSMLVMSIASSAMISMGGAPNPHDQKTSVDKNTARFNIDLLEMLSLKVKGNLTPEEENFMSSIMNDLRLKFIQLK